MGEMKLPRSRSHATIKPKITDGEPVWSVYEHDWVQTSITIAEAAAVRRALIDLVAHLNVILPVNADEFCDTYLTEDSLRWLGLGLRELEILRYHAEDASQFLDFCIGATPE